MWVEKKTPAGGIRTKRQKGGDVCVCVCVQNIVTRTVRLNHRKTVLARQARRTLKRSWSVSVRLMFSVMYNLELLLAQVLNHFFGESQLHGGLQEYKSKNTSFLPSGCYSLIQAECISFQCRKKKPFQVRQTPRNIRKGNGYWQNPWSR